MFAFIISLFVARTNPEPIVLTGEVEAVWVPEDQVGQPIVAAPIDDHVFEVAGE